MLTPSGRFETGTRLCLSMSDFHPETWRAPAPPPQHEPCCHRPHCRHGVADGRWRGWLASSCAGRRCGPRRSWPAQAADQAPPRASQRRAPRAAVVRVHHSHRPAVVHAGRQRDHHRLAGEHGARPARRRARSLCERPPPNPSPYTLFPERPHAGRTPRSGSWRARPARGTCGSPRWPACSRRRAAPRPRRRRSTRCGACLQAPQCWRCRWRLPCASLSGAPRGWRAAAGGGCGRGPRRRGRGRARAGGGLRARAGGRARRRGGLGGRADRRGAAGRGRSAGRGRVRGPRAAVRAVPVLAPRGRRQRSTLPCSQRCGLARACGSPSAEPGMRRLVSCGHRPLTQTARPGGTRAGGRRRCC